MQETEWPARNPYARSNPRTSERRDYLRFAPCALSSATTTPFRAASTSASVNVRSGDRKSSRRTGSPTLPGSWSLVPIELAHAHQCPRRGRPDRATNIGRRQGFIHLYRKIPRRSTESGGAVRPRGVRAASQLFQTVEVQLGNIAFRLPAGYRELRRSLARADRRNRARLRPIRGLPTRGARASPRARPITSSGSSTGSNPALTPNASSSRSATPLTSKKSTAPRRAAPMFGRSRAGPRECDRARLARRP